MRRHQNANWGRTCGARVEYPNTMPTSTGVFVYGEIRPVTGGRQIHCPHYGVTFHVTDEGAAVH